MPEIKVIGTSEFAARLRELEFVFERKALIEIAKTGGRIVADAARVTAPRDSGDMADSINVRTNTKDSTIFEGVVDVAPAAKFFYWRFLEGGTKERFYKHGRKGSSGHITAKHFLANALEATRETVVETMKAKMSEAFKKAVRRGR